MTQERLNELMPEYQEGQQNILRICVGSWHAYNENNKFALGTYNSKTGSFYIDFTLLQDEDELIDLLDFLGWSELDQEELFIQDYESDYFTIENCDNTNPIFIINTVIDSGIDLTNEINCSRIATIIEYEGCDLETALNNFDNYDFYENMTAEEWEKEIWNSCISEETQNLLDSWVGNYISIDFEKMAQDDDSIYESEHGLLILQ